MRAGGSRCRAISPSFRRAWSPKRSDSSRPGWRWTSSDFRGRPVAALATETLFQGSVAPGDLLELDVDIDDCDDEIIAYGGWAKVNGRRVIELRHCLGPMLPVEEFDSPDALRERFALLRGRGAAAGGFRGVAPVPLTVDAPRAGQVAARHADGARACGVLRRSFSPPSGVSGDLAARCCKCGLPSSSPNSLAESRGAAAMTPSRMTNVKMRTFITPGQRVEHQRRAAAGTR